MMPWFTIISLLLQYGPAIIHLLKEIWDLIQHRQVKLSERAGLLKQMRKLADHYKESKDMRPLEQMRDGLRVRCFGTACLPQS